MLSIRVLHCSVLWRTFSDSSKALAFCAPVSRVSCSEYARQAYFFPDLNPDPRVTSAKRPEVSEIVRKKKG